LAYLFYTTIWLLSSDRNEKSYENLPKMFLHIFYLKIRQTLGLACGPPYRYLWSADHRLRTAGIYNCCFLMW